MLLCRTRDTLKMNVVNRLGMCLPLKFAIYPRAKRAAGQPEKAVYFSSSVSYLHLDESNYLVTLP